MQNEQNSQPAAMTDEQLAIVVEQARLATDSHCDGLPHEPTKEYSDAYFARALLSQAQVAQPVSEQNARFAIEAAIDFGRANTNPPPSEDHWLMPFWKIGRQMGDAPESKLTDAEIDGVWRQMPGGPEGWLKEFGYIHFARAIEERLLAAAPVAAQPQVPDLTAVITWLENGCDPKQAVKELRLYQQQIEAAMNDEAVSVTNYGDIAAQPQEAGQARELPPEHDCIAHIYPSDLERMAKNECTATVYSVAVGCPDEKSVPLYTAEQMTAALATPASDRIKELEQKLVDLRVKYEVACSTLDIVKEQRTAAQKALAAQCKAAQAAPAVAVAARELGDDKALVPLIPNAAMREVMEQEDWQWEDLLAAAEAITEEQYSYIAAASAQQEQDRRDVDFYRGVIAALGALKPHHTHGCTVHDEIVNSVGKKQLYAVAEPEDVEWAGLDPEFYAALTAKQDGGKA